MKNIFSVLMLIALMMGGASYGQVIPLTINGKDVSKTKNLEQTIQDPSSTNRIFYNVNLPSLEIFKPEGVSSNNIGILVIPGGGFHILSYDDEGTKIAKELAAQGYTAAVLKYRLVKMEGENPMEQLLGISQDFEKMEKIMAPDVPLAIADGKTAMQYLKNHAKELGFSADKIGVIGFSAGGTIAAALAFDQAVKPIFTAPIYPYLNPLLSKEVPNNPSPLFIAVAGDDFFGFDKISAEFYQKWKAGKGVAELHIYAEGEHGFASKIQGLPVDNWMERFTEWLQFLGYGASK